MVVIHFFFNFLVKRAGVKSIILEMTPADASDSVGDASLSDAIEEDGKTFKIEFLKFS